MLEVLDPIGRLSLENLILEERRAEAARYQLASQLPRVPKRRSRQLASLLLLLAQRIDPRTSKPAPARQMAI
jgi:hypothetical protein